MDCSPNALISRATCTDNCVPRGYLRASQIASACAWVNANIIPTPPVTGAIIISNGVGGFCRLVVDLLGNIGAITDPGPATGTAPVLSDGVGGFWMIVTDSVCDRGTTSVAGPATVPVPTLIDSSLVVWSLVADSSGNLGATS